MSGFIHAADFHIGNTTHGKMNSERGMNSRLIDSEKALERIATRANAEGVPVLFAGDTFHTATPTPTQQRVFADFLKELDVPFIGVTGNHDHPVTQGKSHALEVFKHFGGVQIYDRVGTFDFPELDLLITMLPWPIPHAVLDGEELKSGAEEKARAMKARYKEVLENARARSEGASDRTHVVLGHVLVEGSVHAGSETEISLGAEVKFSPDELFESGADYIALGHIHDHQVWSSNGQVMQYASSISRLDFGEAGEKKGFWVVGGSGHPEMKSTEFVSTEPRPFVTVEADYRDVDIDDVTKQLRGEIQDRRSPGAIMRVRYRCREDQTVDEREVRRSLDWVHKLTSFEREVERERQSRGSGLDPDAPIGQHVQEFAETRELNDIEDALVDEANDIAATVK